MELETTFLVSLPEAKARERVHAYLAQAGYTPTGEQPLQFKRGSVWGNMASFSPLKWQARVSVTTAPQSDSAAYVTAEFAVNTSGQWVTDRERAVWQAEVDAFTRSVQSGDLSTAPVKQALASAKRNTLGAILVFLAVSLVVGLAVAVGGMLLTGRESFTTIGIVVGLAVGYLVLQRFFGVNRIT